MPAYEVLEVPSAARAQSPIPGFIPEQENFLEPEPQRLKYTVCAATNRRTRPFNKNPHQTSYRSETHAQKLIDQINGKLTRVEWKLLEQCPEAIWRTIENIKRNGTGQMESMQFYKVSIKRLRLGHKWYPLLPYVVRTIYGVEKCPMISTEQAEHLIGMIQNIVKVWNDVREELPFKRRSIPNIQMLMYTESKRQGWRAILPLFTLVEQAQEKRKFTVMWNRVLEKLLW